MTAVYVLVGAGMRDGMEIGRSTVLPGCPDEGPDPDVLAHAQDLMARHLVSEGVAGIGFSLFRDRLMEDRMKETEGGDG